MKEIWKGIPGWEEIYQASNPESGVAYGWNKVEGGYSKGYYEMVAVAR